MRVSCMLCLIRLASLSSFRTVASATSRQCRINRSGECSHRLLILDIRTSPGPSQRKQQHDFPLNGIPFMDMDKIRVDKCREGMPPTDPGLKSEPWSDADVHAGAE